MRTQGKFSEPNVQFPSTESKMKIRIKFKELNVQFESIRT